jgi:hypothetical protein
LGLATSTHIIADEFAAVITRDIVDDKPDN